VYIHDDADSATITQQAVSAINECARAVGKLDSSFDAGQLDEIEAAVRQLIAALDRKRSMSRA
jgi:hypothetical protein